MNMYLHVASVVFLSALMATPRTASHAASAESGANIWTLTDCRQEALKQNRDLRAASARLDAARAMTRQAGRWANPGVEGRSVGDEREVILSQEFDLWGRHSTATKLAEAEAETVAHERAILERELMESVTRHYWSLARSQKLMELGDHERDTWRRMLGIREREVELGAIPPAEILTLKQEAAEREQALQQLRFDADSARAALNMLLARQPGDPMMVADALPAGIGVSADVLLAAALATDPSALKARAHLVTAGYRIDQEQRRWRPSPEIGLAFKEEGGEWDTGVQVAFSVPVWDRNRGGIQSAATGQEQALAEVESAQLLAVQRAYHTYRQHESTATALAHYELHVLALEQERLSRTRQALKTGDASEREFLTAQLEAIRREQEAEHLRYRHAEATSLIELIFPAPTSGHSITNR